MELNYPLILIIQQVSPLDHMQVFLTIFLKIKVILWGFYKGFIEKNAVAITPVRPVPKKVNLTQMSLSFKKRKRFVSKNKTAFKKAKGEPNVSFFKESLLVKAGVHRASRVK